MEASHPEFHVESQIMLAEYSALRTEIERRTTIQWNVYALQITSAGAVSALAISAASNFVLLLIIPLSSYMLGGRYLLHDFHIKLIQRYFRDSRSGRLSGRLEWERWKAQTLPDVEGRRWFRVTNWMVFHPTRLAFEGVATLALVAAALSGVYVWWARPPQWALVVGFALMWCLGAFATFLLHQSFDRSANT
jgi:hypothetical protein